MAMMLPWFGCEMLRQAHVLKQTRVSGFGKSVDTLKGGASLEEADHCGAGLKGNNRPKSSLC